MSELDKMFKALPTAVRLAAPSEQGRAVAVFEFSQRGFGFGEVAIVQTADGAYVDSECMGRDKVMELLRIYLDGAIFDTDTDPAKHMAYNAARGSVCGPGCRVCHDNGGEP